MYPICIDLNKCTSSFFTVLLYLVARFFMYVFCLAPATDLQCIFCEVTMNAAWVCERWWASHSTIRVMQIAKIKQKKTQREQSEWVSVSVSMWKKTQIIHVIIWFSDKNWKSFHCDFMWFSSLARHTHSYQTQRCTIQIRLRCVAVHFVQAKELHMWYD